MIRKIIKIDKDHCNGCGLCVSACHEGAIALVDGKAQLTRDDYCDGLGDCLPACPPGAISFEEREAAPFDKEAVLRNISQKEPDPLPCGCPGTHTKTIEPAKSKDSQDPSGDLSSQLRQWPVQIKLASPNARFFDKSHLLIAASCSAYSFGDFHNRFIKNRVALIGCPKLDGVDYAEKLTEILKANDVRSITVVRMEVPCCNGLVSSVKNALLSSGKVIPWQVLTLSVDGQIVEEDL